MIAAATPTATDIVTAAAAAVAAIGTVGTLIAALAQVKRERDARQRLERGQGEHDRRSQAERVSAWIGDRSSLTPGQGASNQPRRQRIELLNASEEPVYRAVIYLVYIQGAAPRTGKEMEKVFEGQAAQGGATPATALRTFLSVIPPGRNRADVDGNWGVMSGRPGVEIAFTDRGGVHWLRAADGALVEIAQAPTEYYGIDGPYDWRAPTMA